MAEKVGHIHVHSLPQELSLDVGDVYRCHCNVEFYVGKDKTDGTKGWFEVQDLVHYDKTVDGGKTFIGRAAPDTNWDELDGSSGEVSDDGTTAGVDSGGTSGSPESGGPVSE